QPLFTVVVHSIDEIAEALVHQLALDLAGRRPRLPLLFRVERLRQNAERLDLLDARKIAVDAIDLDTQEPFDLRMRGEAGEAGVADIVGARPGGYGVAIHFDARRQIFAAVPEHHGFRHIRARAQRVLDERRRNRLAADGDDEVARAVDEPQRAPAPLADIAGAQPSVGALDLACCFVVLPVPVKEILAADQHFAVVRKLDFDAVDGGADIARPGETTALPGTDAARLFGLPVHLDHVDAVDLPERRGLGRQRGDAAAHKLQPGHNVCVATLL